MTHSLRKRQKCASDNMPAPPILPPLPDLRDVSLDWVLQLSVHCEWATPGFMSDNIPLTPRWRRPPEDRMSLQRQETYPQAYRDLVVRAHSTAFDLVRAVLCAFGLETIDTARKEYPRRSNEGSLQAAGNEGGPVTVSLYDGYVTESGPVNGGILGLEYADRTGEVSMGRLKQLRVAQLLDKPHVSSKSRSSTQGVREGILLQVTVPERVASEDSHGEPQRLLRTRAGVRRELQRLHCNAWWISRACLHATGDGLPHELKERILDEARGCCALALPCYYAFHICCSAIGTARDCLAKNWSDGVAAAHGLQPQPVPLARCVAAQGGCYGGNHLDYEPPELPAGKATIDAINTRLSGGIGGRFWHSHASLWCLRAPLFRITGSDETSDETSDKLMATSYRRLVRKTKDGFEKWADELGGMPW